MNSRPGIGMLLGAAILFACAVPSAYCQGMGVGRPGRMYNPKTETTVSGTVEEVETYTRGQGWGGTHFDLKTESGAFDVHVGPTHYITSKGFKFAKGDKVEVIGSKVTFGGHEAIIAREIKTRGKTLTLRDAQGLPEWAGGRRGGGPGWGRGAGAPTK